MKSNKFPFLSGLVLALLLLSGCGQMAATMVFTGEEPRLADGVYWAEVSLSGGTGRATVASPAQIRVEEGQLTATLQWSSPNYDYMVVEGEKFTPITTDPGSTFQIPIPGLDVTIPVTADTTAMSQPHEIDYELVFLGDTLEEAP